MTNAELPQDFVGALPDFYVPCPAPSGAGEAWLFLGLSIFHQSRTSLEFPRAGTLFYSSVASDLPQSLC